MITSHNCTSLLAQEHYKLLINVLVAKGGKESGPWRPLLPNYFASEEGKYGRTGEGKSESVIGATSRTYFDILYKSCGDARATCKSRCYGADQRERGGRQLICVMEMRGAQRHVKKQ